jgi:hypothetical protein
MTTYATFTAAVAALSIAGRKRAYTSPPMQITTADLPASYPRLPSGGLNPDSLSTCTSSGNRRVVDLVVVVEPMGQGTQPQNYAATLAIIDAVENALRTASDGGTITPWLEWTLSIAPVVVGDTPYWAVTATVTGIE